MQNVRSLGFEISRASREHPQTTGAVALSESDESKGLSSYPQIPQTTRTVRQGPPGPSVAPTPRRRLGRTEQNSEIRNQNAELRRRRGLSTDFTDYTDSGLGRQKERTDWVATKTRKTRNGPEREPPRTPERTIHRFHRLHRWLGEKLRDNRQDSPRFRIPDFCNLQSTIMNLESAARVAPLAASQPSP